MAFDPSRLPPSVYQAYRQGPIVWPLVVEKAIQAGMSDINKLTDLVFFLHHPERHGRRLGPGEVGLINQWKNFRNMIAPRLKTTSAPTSLSPEGSFDWND